jgi:xylose isomerase
VDLRRAFNEVRVLDGNRYYEKGMVGMDVKAIRTQPAEVATKHLRNSMQIFLRLVEVVRSLDQAKYKELISACDYEELDWFILDSLMGTH